MTRLQKLRPYLLFFTGSFVVFGLGFLLNLDPVSDFFEDLFDTDDIGYGVIIIITLLIIYLIWSVIGGILYYKLTHRIILSNLASFVGYWVVAVIYELLHYLLGPKNYTLFSWGRFEDPIRSALILSILPFLVSVITMLLSRLSERNKSEQEKEQEEKEVL